MPKRRYKPLRTKPTPRRNLIFGGPDMSDLGLSEISLTDEAEAIDNSERNVLLTLALVIAVEIGALGWLFY
jgi:hypothetical protein